MSDKQRADHVQAKYWNGFITRTEAQTVFDDQLKVISNVSMTLQKMDAVISFMAEKIGVTAEEVQAWMTKKVADAEIANSNSNDANLQRQSTVAEPKRIIEA